jgi:uncharacterized membrane protein
MKNLSLDSILLFAFVVPFIMTYRIGPGDTPYMLFGLIFLGLLLYVLFDVFSIQKNLYFLLKRGVLWLLIIGVVGGAFISAIIVRHQTSPIYMIHDIIPQQETAIRFLLHGKNPYAVTYFGTPLEQWNYSTTEVNPALYHFVMEPFYVLSAIPVYIIGNHLFGFFDGRMPLLILLFSLILMAQHLVKDQRNKLVFLVLLTFNPAMLGFTLEGRSDIYMFTFLFAGFYLLHVKRYTLSAIPIALAFAVKQSAWPLFPFYIAFLLIKTKNLKKAVQALFLFILTFSAIVMPFIFWDAKAFFESTVLYLSGNALHSYPISGYGFGKLLNQAGFIKDTHDYYPFQIWQIGIGIPVLLFLLKFLKAHCSVGKLILVYGIFLFVFWYFSRYFNNSHLGYLSIVFITAYFWPQDKGEST